MRCLPILFCLYAAALGAAPRVVTSIAPLQEITAAVMRGAGEPDLLIDRGASPHHFALKPSHLRLLERADLVIWIDRRFESGFARLPAVLPDSARRLELLPRLDSDSEDGHIWYSPRRLLNAIDLVAGALARTDPANAALYRDNAAALAGEIEAWRDGLARDLRGKRVALLADHAFLGYLAEEFPELEIEAIHDGHDDHGGIRQLNAIEQWAQEHRPHCLLTQEGQPAALARQLAAKFRLEIVDLDAPPAPGARPGIPGRLDRLRATLARCAAG